MAGSLIVARAPPDEVDLDELIARLKALAAAAQESPPSRMKNRRLVTAAAIALSITSGAVTGQYLIPGHSRASAVPPSKSFAGPQSARDTILESTRRW